MNLSGRICGALLAVGVLAHARPCGADAVAQVANSVEEIRQQADQLGPRYLQKGGFKGADYVAERLVDGENFYRVKDYQRSAIIFLDIVENYPTSAAYGDALFLYADSLFLVRDYLGARVWFRRLLDERKKPGLERFRQKAIERLIEIAIHLEDYQGVEDYFEQLGREPSAESIYVQGKFLFFKGDLDRAAEALARVQGDPLLELKALYLQGVIRTQQERYKEAIDLFLKAESVKPANRDQQEIVDLLILGAGRLYFEQGFVQHASECYQRISETSSYFDAALYEAAAVLIRAGDTIRAEQILEVLTVAVPDSRYIPKAKMLRANLLLRTGRYDDAEKVFDEVIVEFTPLKDQLDEVIRQQSDTRRFFDDLVERSMSALDVHSILPPLVVKWVGESPEVRRALELAGDIGTATASVEETERLIGLLGAVIDGPSRVNAIPVLRQAMRRGQGLSNRLCQERARLTRVALKELGGGNADVQRLDRKLGEMEPSVGALPTSDSAFDSRELKARQVYQSMRRELKRDLLALDQLSAMAVAIERYVADPNYLKEVKNKDLGALKGQLALHRQAVEEMRGDLGTLTDEVNRAGYQVGVGDSDDARDQEIRAAVSDINRQARKLLGAKETELAKRVREADGAIDEAQALLDRFGGEVAQEARRQVGAMRDQLLKEEAQVSRYQAELGSLNREAEKVVGGVAYASFSSVRQRFQDLILKADVGIIDVAWLLKEEHAARISEITKQRLTEIKALDDEFQEVRGSSPAEEK